ncbi:MAG: hypothetical protein ACL93V_15440 [Candidatus Electrothrix sp. YB6]
MEKIKLFFSAILVGMTMLMGVGSAEAVSANGTIRITQVRPGGRYYIYFTSSSVLPAFGYYCRTDDDILIQTARNAMENHLQVKIGCLNTFWSDGTFRYGGEVYAMNIYNY